MNIIVKPHGSDLCYCRPDTTWERENRDFYSPDCVNEVLWTPIVFARVSKAGKCIGKKFASRYYDAVGCGILMYGNNDMAFGSCIDHTSILPMPLHNPEVLEEEKAFKVFRNDEPFAVMSTEQNQWRHLLEEALCNASRLTSVRIGDFIAVELASPAGLATREDKEVSVKGIFCDNEIFSFQIRF